jgi:hypothetical protein
MLVWCGAYLLPSRGLLLMLTYFSFFLALAAAAEVAWVSILLLFVVLA